MPPRSRVEEDLDALDLSPAQACIAAMLRYAVQDARSQGLGKYQQERRRRAQAWLRDREAVLYWLTLMGLPEETYDALMKEAELKEDTKT
jgi:hypothetical protein